MKNIIAFENFIGRVNLTPKKLAEINNLIFYNWNEREAKKFLPQHIVDLISSIQNDDCLLNQVFDCLIELKS
jgi:hypothetical protein